MGRRGGMQRGRYRGTNRMGAVGFLFLCLIAIALAVGAGCLLLSRDGPEPDPLPPGQTSPLEVPDDEKETLLPDEPEGVRGIYISGPVAGDPYMEKLLTLIDETELNSVVIDVKNDEGILTYRPDSGLALEIGACVRYVEDMPALVAELKEHNIYAIARVVAFKDPVLAKARPELALRYQNGSPVGEGGGAAWVNPCDPAVWDYLEEVALGAADLGFDEIQFDYVRFPTGRSMDRVDYGTSGEVVRTDVIAEFLERITGTLHEKGVRVSADVFGTVITNRTDGALIGQDYVQLAGIVDYICPMVYPSHYASGAFGLDIPDQEPYQAVLSALSASKRTLSGQKDGVRAWLQDFTAVWVAGHIDYGAEELRAQIQAVYDAGYTDWLLWNAKNNYTAEGLLKTEKPATD